jgi:group I intron endonuclease
MFVYCIKNLVNDKVYVGQSTQKTDHRLQEHKSKLRSNTHENIHLQRAWNKYGESNFEIRKLETVETIDELNRLETRYAKQFRVHDRQFGYNIRGTGDNRFVTEETKKRISTSKLGVPVHTKASKAKIRKASRNRIHTIESKLKRSVKLKGYVWPIEVRNQWAKTHRHDKEYPIILSPNAIEYQPVNMSAFCAEHNLLQQSMSKLILGQLKSHHGWVIK